MRRFKIFYDIIDCSFSIADPYTNVVGKLEIKLIENNGPIEITLIDLKDTIEKTVINKGLRAIVDIHEESIDKASKEANVRLEAFLTLLTLVTNATVGEALLKLAYETTESAISTEYLQIEYLNSDLLKRKRSIENTKFQQLGEKFINSTNGRIARAVRWYRKGLIEVDPLDRFMSYWVGLENLNKILEEALGTNTELRLCASCGEPYEVPTSKGIRALFEKHSMNGLKDFKLCRDLRVDLQHGSGALESAMNRIYEASEICRLSLLRAIYISLNLNIQELDTYPMPIYNIYQPRVEFRGQYKISPKDLPEIPYLVINTKNIKVSDFNGKRTIELTDKIDSTIPVEMTIEMTTVFEHGVETDMVDSKLVPRT